MSRRFAKAHPCPTATKSSWPDQASADAALAYLATQPAAEFDGVKPARSYRCECGSWHLTSSRISYADRATVGARETHSPVPR